MDRYKLSLAAVLSALFLQADILAPPAEGQVVAPKAEDAESDSPQQRVFLPPDRSLRQLLNRAEQLLAEQRFTEAAQALHSVLNSPEDYFYRTENIGSRKAATNYRSLKNEARRLIGQLPPGGKRAYALQFDEKARHSLDEAVAAGDMEAVAEVTRRFSHTKASDEALILLGRYHLDQGRPLAAAFCLEQAAGSSEVAAYEPDLSLLLAVCWGRSGQPEKSAEILKRVQQRWPDARLPLADRSQILPISNRPVEHWVAMFSRPSNRAQDEKQWTLFLGNPTRTASTAADRPLLLRPCWRQRVAIEPKVEAAISARARQMFDQSVPAVPALHPLAAGDFILMRGAGKLAAVNMLTGKLAWQNEASDRSSGPPDLEQDPADLREAPTTQPASDGIWNDKTLGTISSDGELVFAIVSQQDDDTSDWLPLDPALRRRSVAANQGVSNALAAYDIAHGNRRWWIGGPDGVEPKLEQALFLGPPLPLQGRLYCVAELAGEVRLVVLSAESGRLLWSQQLAIADDEVARDQSRYGAGVSPSLADGVLVCPTTSGAVVAIDLTTRSLLWGYQYPRDAANETVRDPFAGAFIRMRRSSPGGTDDVPSTWRDSCPILSGGLVVITPAESTQLHCLSLKDGQLKWKIDRQDYVYVAAVHGNNVVLVGQQALSAIALSGPRRGQVVATTALPEGSLPNGRGCYTGREYYLPLLTSTGAGIACIDLDQSKVVGRYACRDGTAAGNLISYRGHIFSQGPDWLQCYHHLGGLKQRVDAELAQKPDDPGALALRAQILSEEHNQAEALPLLRKAYATYTKWIEAPQKDASPDERSRRQEALAERIAVREQLVDGLLEYLKTHFEAREEVGRELASLIDLPDQRIRLLRIVAEGLAAAHDTDGAMANYFQLVQLADEGPQWVSVDPAQSVRLDRWLAARLGKLSAGLEPQSRRQFDRRVADHLAAAEKKNTEAALSRHVALFEGHPSAQSARLRLARLRETPETLLQRVRWLQAIADNDNQEALDSAAVREATARLARLLLETQRADAAEVYFDRLLRRWPSTVCLDGRTGTQLFEALPTDSPVRKPKSISTGWPVGHVKVTQGTTDSRYSGFSYQAASELVIEGQPAHGGLRVFLDIQQQVISGLDSLGRPKWRIPLARDSDGNPMLINRGMATGRFDGHVLLLSLGSHVIAVNTLKPGGPRNDGVLWMDQCGGVLRTADPDSRNAARPWQDDSTLEQAFAQSLAQLGPVVAGGATYLRSRELVCVDPLTGQRYWTRRDVAPGSDLFGDDEMLLAVAPNSSEALVIQSSDGVLLGRRKVPVAADRFTTIGTKIVCVKEEAGGKKMTLRLLDPWKQQTVWQLPLADGAKMARVDATTAALLDRQGRFMLLNLQTGKPILQQQLEKEPRLSALHVVASRDCLIVMANQPDARKDESPRIEAAHENGGPIVNGRVYALHPRSGVLLWPIAAKVEGYALVLDQPVDIPLVAFARWKSDSNSSSGQKTSFLFLDKRTGALATPIRDYPRRITNFEIVGDDEKKVVQVHLRSMANTLTLAYTNNPAPPEPPLQAGERPKAPAPSFRETLDRAMRSLGKAAKELSNPPADKKQQEKDLFGE